MENVFLSVLFALIQGITEAIPVSSSTHLVLASKLLNQELDLAFIVSLHFGTLMAFFVYFHKDIIDMIRDVLTLKFDTQPGKLALSLLIATIPASIVGFLLKDTIEAMMANVLLIALGLGITSLTLFIASIYKPSTIKKEISFKSALIIGLAQIASLFRGVSRSGSTISAGLLSGLDEKTAVKFSFLLSIPIVLGANILSLGNEPLSPSLFLPAMLSCIVGIGAIHISYTYILHNRNNLKWFALYTGILALAIVLTSLL